MRIGLNLLYLIPNHVGGSETYAVELIKGFGRINPDMRFVIFLNQEAKDFPLPPGPFERVVCKVRASNRIHRYLFEQCILPFLAIRHRVDILHSLGYVGPIFCPRPHLVSILDANFIRLASLMSPLKRGVYKRVARYCARTCDHVATLSEFSKKELLECLPINSDKISVIHLAAQEPAPQEEGCMPLSLLDAGKPYFLAIGGGSPHKNIRALVQAFIAIHPQIPHSLVIAGRVAEPLNDLPLVPELIESGRIILTGFLTADVLDSLYRGASLYAFPTLYEGFGLPILEAQVRGIPVACSRVASLPEVAGESVAYFEPRSVEDIASVLQSLLESPNKLAELRNMGTRNVERFTWNETSRKTLELYRIVANRTTLA